MEEAAGNWEAIVDFAEGHDVALMVALGKVVITGIVKVEGMEKFAQPGRLSYETHFPMPDDREWELEVRPRPQPSVSVGE